MMLIIAILTVIKFATASHQNSFFVQDILKSNRNVATSRTVLSDAVRHHPLLFNFGFVHLQNAAVVARCI